MEMHPLLSKSFSPAIRGKQKLFPFVFLCLSLFIGSCNEEVPEVGKRTLDQETEGTSTTAHTFINDKNVKVVDGVLHFIDSEGSFREDVEKILSMNEREFEAWEASIGFKSLRSVINEAHEAFDKLTTEAEFLAWQNKYKDVVEMRDSTVTPLVSDWVSKTFANRAGEYYIGEAYRKVTPEKLVTIKNGDKSKLKAALQLESSREEEGILVKKFDAPQMKVLATCPLNYHIAARREDGKRRAYITFTILSDCALWLCKTVIQVQLYGQKKGVFGWNKYSTSHYADGINYYIRNALGVFESRPTPVTYQSSSDEKDAYIYFALSDSQDGNNYNRPDYFEAAVGRVANRGTGQQFAVICCGGFTCPPADGGSPY